jgi:hypothetical protein
MNFIVGLLPAGLVCVWIWLSDICLLDRFYLAQQLLSLAMHVTQFVVKKPCFKKLSDFHQFVWEIGRKTGVADFSDRRFLEPYLELRRLHESKIIQWNVAQKVCPSPIQKLFEVLWFYRQIKYSLWFHGKHVTLPHNTRQWFCFQWTNLYKMKSICFDHVEGTE